MQQTTNLHLNMPEYNDAADMQVINGNMEAIDTKFGTVDSSISAAEADIGKHEGYIVTLTNVSSLMARYPSQDGTTDDNIEDDMGCIKSIISNPDTQGSDWTVTTYNGYLQITGTFLGSATTHITLYLMKSM